MNKRWYAPLLSIAAYAAASYSDAASAWVSHHPKVAGIMAGITTFLAFFHPQPQKAEPPKY